MLLDTDSFLAPRAAVRGGAPLIGLVNLMPKSGMMATARQFAGLLQPLGAEMRFFAPAEGADGHEPIGRLWTARLDGMIVSGTEPAAATMEREPSWPLLRDLVDFASGHVGAAVWSCFAAHAAVWRLDGIGRQPLAEKLSGVFACEKKLDHPILAHMPASWHVPHSRLNALAESALRDAGYSILTGGPALGADSFAKRHGICRSLFLQGHPEYEHTTLAAEYRRDLQRYRDGTRAQPPRPPIAVKDAAWRQAAEGLFAGWLDARGKW